MEEKKELPESKTELNTKKELKNEVKKSEEDLELNIDFSKIISKIKNFDFKKVTEKLKPLICFIKNNKTLCVLLLVILLSLTPNFGFLPWGGIWMRMKAKDLVSIDSVVEKNINSLLENQISSEINSRWPNLPNEKKKELVKSEVEKWKKNNKEEYEKAITQQIESIKQHYKFEYAGKTYPYMPDIDPYNYVRYAENYLDHGYFGDAKKNGIQWDYHTLAPVGRSAALQTSLHVFVIALVYKFFSLFSNTHILFTTSYLPVIFTFLSLFPVFFLTKRLSNNLGAFLATNMLMVHFMFLSRTLWGYADTDFYNVFFPLIISWVFFEAVINKKWYNKLPLAFGSAFLFFLYLKSWLGSWFVFDLILASCTITIIYKYINKKFYDARNLLFLLLAFVAFSSVLIGLFLGMNHLLNPLMVPLGFTNIKNAANKDLWPNVYTTVAELNEQSLSNILTTLGTPLIIISIIGIVFLLIKKTPQTIMGSFYLILWFLATVYASTKGSRFLLLLIPAISILFGIGSSFIINYSSKILKKKLNVNKMISSSVLFFLILLTFLSPVKASYQLVFGNEQGSAGALPIMNDAWWEALTYIKEQSDENAIITSWWDFGHHFKYVADRAVTFDGASQNSPMAHWVGRLLLTNSEKEAIGILRMLDCGSNNAFEAINKKLNNTPKSVSLIYDLITLNKSKASDLLKRNNFSESELKEVLNFTHCNPPQAFVITSQDMISKAGVWAHFGNWDFIKADLWENYKTKSKREIIELLTKEYSYSDKEAKELYEELKEIKSSDDPEKRANSWIGEWDSYVNTENPFQNCKEQKNNIICPNSLVIVNETPYLMTSETTALPIDELSYIDKNGNWQQKKIQQKTGFGAVLIRQKGKFKSIVARTPLAASLFTRLFFLEGHGLKYFKKVKETNQLIGGKIIVWEVDWEGNQQNSLPGVVEKQVVEAGDTVFVNYAVYNSDGLIDSSIQNWSQKNITRNINFEDYETKPFSLVVTNQLNPVIREALIGMKKGEEKILQIDPKQLPIRKEDKKQSEEKIINLKIKVEQIF